MKFNHLLYVTCNRKDFYLWSSLLCWLCISIICCFPFSVYRFFSVFLSLVFCNFLPLFGNLIIFCFCCYVHILNFLVWELLLVLEWIILFSLCQLRNWELRKLDVRNTGFCFITLFITLVWEVMNKWETG